MDITVYQSDRHRSPGHLSRQGPPALRWALYEAAQRARFPSSPDREYYLQAAERLGGNRACLALARSCSSAATTRCESSAKTRSRHHRPRRATGPLAGPRAARQAADLARPRRQQLRAWGCPGRLTRASAPAVWQRTPACRPAHPIMNFSPSRSLRASSPHSTSDAPRPAPRTAAADTPPRGRPRKIERPQRFPQRDHPNKHLVAGPKPTPGRGPKQALGARAHTIRSIQHASPTHPHDRRRTTSPKIQCLTAGAGTSVSSCRHHRAFHATSLHAPIRPMHRRRQPGRGSRVALGSRNTASTSA